MKKILFLVSRLRSIPFASAEELYFRSEGKKLLEELSGQFRRKQIP